MWCDRKINQILRLILGVMLVTLTVPAFAAAKAASLRTDEMTFLTLSDFHFDPFISCHNAIPCPLIQKLNAASSEKWPAIFKANSKDAPEYRQDSNYTLLTSALVAAKKTADERRVKFVIILGDFLGHEFRDKYKKFAKDNAFAGYQAFVEKTMTFLTDEIAHTFPNIDVYNVIGNNDSYNRDYVSVPKGVFFKDIGSMWAGLIKTKANRAALVKNFPVGGYYAVNAPGDPGLRLIILNSVFFSYKATSKNNDQAAMEQLKWLHQELQLAHDKNQKVIIAMHIPPGIDIYATLKVRFFRLIDLWKLNFTKIFEDDLKEYAPEMVGILSGHLHSDWSQVLTLDDTHSISISGTTSISPIFGNNPGFKVFTYSIKNRQLENADAYVYPMDKKSTWNILYWHNQMVPSNLQSVRKQLVQN